MLVALPVLLRQEFTIRLERVSTHSDSNACLYLAKAL